MLGVAPTFDGTITREELQAARPGVYLIAGEVRDVPGFYDLVHDSMYDARVQTIVRVLPATGKVNLPQGADNIEVRRDGCILIFASHPLERLGDWLKQ